MSSKVKLRELSQTELEDFFLSLGEKRYRAKQVMQWLYRYRVNTLDEMKTLSKTLREKLRATADIQKFNVIETRAANDGSAVKMALSLSPQKEEVVECVALIDGKRITACLSSQIGCRYGCKFCCTAKMGFMRNLTPGEILGQVTALQDHLGEKRISNIVFMGMGEPMDNLDAVLRAVGVIQADDGFVIGGRKITVSTCGVVPGIQALADSEANLGLAVSLNAPNDAIRKKLMPVNNKYPMEDLLEAAGYYFKKTGRRVTFEYVLISGVNSSAAHIDELCTRLRGLKCKLNLIALNPGAPPGFSGPPKAAVRKILERLEPEPFTATVRKSLGSDIAAACGQLYRDLMKG